MYLYDRQEQKRELLSSFERITEARNSSEIVLITGGSGTGKTSLAHSLRTDLSGDRSCFVSGKFDQYQRLGHPYSALVRAFTEYAEIILKQEGDNDDCEARKVRDAVTTELMVKDQVLLVDMIQPLGRLLGVERSKEPPTFEEHMRFNLVFKRFIRSICSPEEPLVLFLDDLQWAGVGALDLIKSLILDKENRGLMLLGACRANQVSFYDPLSALLREMEREGVTITNIGVKNLGIGSVRKLLSDHLSLSTSQCADLASVLHRHTDGNCFFLVQYLQYLRNSGIIKETDNTCTWDREKLEAAGKENDSVGLAEEKLLQLPNNLRHLLKYAACLGSEFDQKLLQDVAFEGSDEEFSDQLRTAEVEGSLICNKTTGTCRFVHDAIQQAAYSLIPTDQRSTFHLNLGRKLHQCRGDGDEGTFFLLVNQLGLGIDQISAEDEKEWASSLCLEAAYRAAQSAAFKPAAEYIELGIKLLQEHHWRDQYDLSISLFNTLAEVEYCNANFEKTGQVIQAVLENARNPNDKIRAQTTLVYALGSRNEVDAAIDTGISVLQDLGEPLPNKGGTVQIILQYIKTKRMLKSLTDEDILNLPLLKDRKQAAIVRLMHVVSPYLFSCRPELSAIVLFRLVQASLRFGISAMTSAAFGGYAMFLCIAFSEIEEGNRYGQLALKLARKFETEQWIPRVYVSVYGMVKTWTKPLEESLDPLMTAYRLGMGTGDIESSMLAAALYSFIGFHSARNLSTLLDEMNGFRRLMIDYKQDHILSMLLPTMQLVLNFLGRCDDPLVLTGEVVDEEKAMRKARETKNDSVLSTYQMNKIFIASYTNKYDSALQFGKDISRLQTKRNPIPLALRPFFQCLSCLGLARTSPKKNPLIRQAKRSWREMQRLPTRQYGFQEHRHLLIEAELVALDRRPKEAIALYNRSIDSATSLHATSEVALSSERAALMIRDTEKEEASDFFTKSLASYREWGAELKVKQLLETKQ